MTDPHPFDELASAHLDGATSAEEAALVTSDPALQARVDELRAVRAAMGELPAVDAARREAAIAAALSAFAEDDAPARRAATVTPMPARRGPSPQAIRVLSTAAVVALLALLIPLIASIDGGSDDEAKSFDSTGDAIEGANTDGGMESAPEASTTTGAAGAVTDKSLGTYADLDDLAADVAAGALAGREAPVGPEAGDGGQESFCPPSDANTASGTAVVAGETVLVWLTTASDGTRTMTVLSADGCQILEEREL